MQVQQIIVIHCSKFCWQGASHIKCCYCHGLCATGNFNFRMQRSLERFCTKYRKKRYELWFCKQICLLIEDHKQEINNLQYLQDKKRQSNKQLAFITFLVAFLQDGHQRSSGYFRRAYRRPVRVTSGPEGLQPRAKVFLVWHSKQQGLSLNVFS